MTKLFLHAGTPKTGTTTIQAFASRFRAELRERGLIYPRLARPFEDRPHHLFTHAAAGRAEELDAAALRRMAKGWRKTAERRGAAVFFSSETLYRLLLRDDGAGDWFERRERYLRRFAELLKGFEIEPVLVFRQPDDFARSALQGNSGNILDEQVWSSFAELREILFAYRLRYARNAEMFERVFGGVRVMIFEDLVEGGRLPQAFFGRLGFDVSDLDDEVDVRKSPTAAETTFKIFINNTMRAEGKAKGKRKLGAFLKSDRFKTMIETQGPGPYGVWESTEARAEFVRRVEGEVEELRRRYFPDRETLFPQLGKGETPPPFPALSPDLERSLIKEVRNQPVGDKKKKRVRSKV